MKKKLLGLVLCLGFIFLFGTSNKSYEVSSIIYTANNSNLIGKEVKVKGIDTSFHIIGVDGKKVRLLSNEITSGRYNYNSSGDGEIPVVFENSQAYQVLMDNYSKYKDQIAAAGGDSSIFELDIPTIEEFCDLGYLDRGEYEVGHHQYGNYKYNLNEKTPEWLFIQSRHWFTKSITNDKKYVYSFSRYFSSDHKWENNASAGNPVYDQAERYGGSVRPVLETSVFNLISSDADVMEYVNSFITNNSNDNKNDDLNNDKAQTVKVPSTGADAPLIFTVVGIAIVVIAGIIIWVIVKDKKGKK